MCEIKLQNYIFTMKNTNISQKQPITLANIMKFNHASFLNTLAKFTSNSSTNFSFQLTVTRKSYFFPYQKNAYRFNKIENLQVLITLTKFSRPLTTIAIWVINFCTSQIHLQPCSHTLKIIAFMKYKSNLNSRTFEKVNSEYRRIIYTNSHNAFNISPVTLTYKGIIVSYIVCFWFICPSHKTSYSSLQ